MTIHEIAERLQPRVEDLCRELLPQGTKQGHEWKAGDVTGAPGDSLTVELNGSKAGLWCDQATSEGGDIVDLVAASKVLSVGKAAKWAREWLGLPDDIQNGSAAANGHFDPLKVGFKRQDETVWRNGSAAWTYHDADGKPIGWVVRFDRPGGGKDILPLRMIDGKPKWKGWKNPEPKPLYNLHLLTRRPDAPILIVEGEKTADAAAKLFPQSVVMTWAAGAKNVSSVDWAPVVAAVASGRPIRLWPDADKPGREAMLYLKARFPTALMVRTEDLPDGWDLADPVPAGISVQGLYDAAGQEEAEAPKPEPTSPESYLKRIVLACVELPAAERNIEVAKIVVEGLRARGQFYHQASHPDFRSAFYFDSSSKVLEKIHSDRFKQTVSDTFAINRASPVWAFVFAEVENASIGASSIAIEPEAFWASRYGPSGSLASIYLSNGAGHIVRIVAGDVRLVDNGTDGVLFQRGATLPPWKLVDPKDPFEACDVFSGISTHVPHAKLLTKLWAMSLPTAPKNKPPLCLAGEVGSGKTRFAKGVCELYGLPVEAAVLKVEEDSERDFWPVMDGGGLVILDNVDTKTKWLPDALAAAATGGAQIKRKLYTDGEVVAMRPRGWVAITTARPESFAGDSGLADRMMVVRMNRRAGDTKDEELSRQIAVARDAGLSWISCKLAFALASTAQPTKSLNRRHPDFATFAYRIGRAIGREAEAVECLSAAEADKSIFCIENDSVGSAILALLRNTGSFEGTAKELIEALKSGGQIEQESKLTSKSIAKRLESIWPHMQSVTTAKRQKIRSGFTHYSFQFDQADEPAIQDPELAME